MLPTSHPNRLGMCTGTAKIGGVGVGEGIVLVRGLECLYVLALLHCGKPGPFREAESFFVFLRLRVDESKPAHWIFCAGCF